MTICLFRFSGGIRLSKTLKKYFPLFLAGVLLLVFVSAYVKGEKVSYCVSSISSGSLSTLTFTKDSVFEADWNIQVDSFGGFGVSLKYPAETVITDQSVLCTMTSETGKKITSEAMIRAMGFVGDGANEGMLIFDFRDNEFPKGSYRVELSARNFAESDSFLLLVRNKSYMLSPVSVNGEPTESCYLSGNQYYSPASERNNRILYFAIALPFLCIIWFFIRKDAPQREVGSSAERKEKRRFSMKAFALLLILVLIEAVCLEYAYFRGLGFGSNQTESVNKKGSVYMTLFPGDTVTWDTVSSMDRFAGVTVQISPLYQDDLSAVLEILDAETGEILGRDEFGPADFIPPESDNLISLKTEPVDASENRNLRIRLSLLSGDLGLQLLTEKGDETIPYYTNLYNSYYFLAGYFKWIAVLLILGTVIAFVLVQANAPTEIIFLAVYLPLLIVFSMLIKPISVPDEYAHMDMAIQVSNKLMGVPDSPFPNVLYKEKALMLTDPMTFARVGKWSYLSAVERLGKAANSDGAYALVYSRDQTKGTSILYFLFSGIGVSIGRMLGLDFTGIAYAGRICNQIAGTILLYLAIRKARHRKYLFASLACIPVALQELCSIAPDAVLMPAIFLMISLTASMLTDPDGSDYRDVLLLLLLMLIVPLCKGGAYLPLLFLPAGAVIRFFSGKHSKVRFPRYVKILLSILLIVAILSIGFFFTSALRTKLTATQSGSYSARRASETYTLSYLITHPGTLFRLLEGTLYYETPYHLFNWAGRGLGWIRGIHLGYGVQLLYFFLFSYLLLSSDEDYSLSGKASVVAMLSVILSFGAFAAAMASGWTRFGELYIDGMQGRYYLPFAPFLFLTAFPERLRLRRQPDGFALIACSVFGAIAAGSFVISVLK